MRKATIKSLLAHKLRLLLTAISVILGVAFIAGTLILTDTLNATFDQLFGSVYQHVAVEVRAVSPFSATSAASADRSTVPASLVSVVAAVPGVQQAVGNTSGFAQLVDPKTGKAIASGGAPTLGTSWTSASTSPLRLVSGAAPAGPGQIAIDRVTAANHDLKVGETVQVLLKGPPQRETIVGIFTFGSSGNLAGATLTAFAPAVAQQLVGTPGAYTAITASADPGISQTTLRARVAAALPAGYEAITGTQLTTEDSDSIKSALGFFDTLLLLFALVALFVGVFIIFNTFTMLVAQRTRELALFRAVGASRSQITRSVLAEALVVGVAGATIGLGLGVLLAIGLKAVLSAFGITLPAHPLVVTARTPIVAYLVGVLVTVAAAYPPARRAAKIPPVAAMREHVDLPRSLMRRAIGGAVLTILGVASMALGLSGAGQPAALVGVGAAAVFIGIAILSPFVSRPVVRVIGAPLARAFRLPGKLGRANASRNPRRTAATAAALMVGIAVVTTMSVLSSSLSSSLDTIVATSVGADFILTSSSTAGFSSSAAAAARQVPGVEAVAEYRVGSAAVGKGAGASQIQGTDPATVADSLNLAMVSGSLAGLNNGLLVDQTTANKNHWTVGQVVPVTFARTGLQHLVIGGIYKRNQVAGSYLVSLATFDRNFENRLDTAVTVKLAPGASANAVDAALTAAVARVAPNVTVQNQTQFEASQRKQVSSLLGLVTVLLALALLIAGLGIVNTLALSVLERTREIGLLRAVGMSRRQLRWTIQVESIITALFGAVLGIVLGVLFGWALVSALSSQGISNFSLSVPQLVSYVIIAALIGVLAALVPARRAARMDVLRAIATT